MSDVEINVSGNMSPPEQPESRSLSNFIPVPGNVREWLSLRRQNIRPWATFFNTNLFRIAPNVQFVAKRVIRNLDYFLSNYLIVFIVLTIYCLLTNPLLILVVILSFTACHMLSLRSAERPIILFGRQLTKHQQYLLVGIISLPVYYWAGVGSAVFWILGASCLVIGMHAAFFNISALQLSDDDHFDLILEDV